MVTPHPTPRPTSGSSPDSAPGPRRSAFAEDHLRRQLRARLLEGRMESCDHLQTDPQQVAAWAPAMANRWVCAGCLGSLDDFVRILQLAGHLVLTCAVCQASPDHLVSTANRTHTVLGFFCRSCLERGAVDE